MHVPPINLVKLEFDLSKFAGYQFLRQIMMKIISRIALSCHSIPCDDKAALHCKENILSFA